mmetsp:Transcript_80290/g.259423  ORF Transcript_80290/g.259423 Transcript_80290/m.259423 type:complete len:216 (+) Transcript_80290:485-1132(+)
MTQHRHTLRPVVSASDPSRPTFVHLREIVRVQGRCHERLCERVQARSAPWYLPRNAPHRIECLSSPHRIRVLLPLGRVLMGGLRILLAVRGVLLLLVVLLLLRLFLRNLLALLALGSFALLLGGLLGKFLLLRLLLLLFLLLLLLLLLVLVLLGVVATAKPLQLRRGLLGFRASLLGDRTGVVCSSLGLGGFSLLNLGSGLQLGTFSAGLGGLQG